MNLNILRQEINIPSIRPRNVPEPPNHIVGVIDFHPSLSARNHLDGLARAALPVVGGRLDFESDDIYSTLSGMVEVNIKLKVIVDVGQVIVLDKPERVTLVESNVLNERRESGYGRHIIEDQVNDIVITDHLVQRPYLFGIE
jgi:hypothetical protein